MLSKVNKDIFILGIESSCDDTSVAIAQNKQILSNIVCTQKIHKQYGGVVPELASREHQKNIIPTIELALREAGIQKEIIDAIAFTVGPGLMGSLLVGASFAKSLSIALDKPLIAINHMSAHVLANCIDQEPEFPFICLTVSGGHTQIVLVKDVNNIKILGETLDDSAGETFDKCAKMLGLEYPGGPAIEKHAKNGNPNIFHFTKPKVNKLNFSFSGLKTNFMHLIKRNTNQNFIKNNLANLCASIQSTIIHILIKKLELAIITHQPKMIAISGGVAANEEFRRIISQLKHKYNIDILIPKKEYSTDNAAMIAIAGYYKWKLNEFSNLSIKVQPKYQLKKHI